MPFTLAHPAAAVPLRRLFGRHAVLSALVIGSVTPDLWYVLPLGFTRGFTHSAAGLLLFCLPAGLLIYLLFHAVLKRPLLALCPEPLSMRLAAAASLDSLLPPASWIAVAGAVLAGAATHLVWDSFTHAGGFGLSLLPGGRMPLFSIGPYTAHGSTLLQYGSALVGMGLLAWWLWRWFERTPPQRIAHAVPLSSGARWVVLLALVLAACFNAADAMVTTSYAGGPISTVRALAKNATGGFGAGLGAGVIAYGIVWQLLAIRRGRHRPGTQW